MKPELEIKSILEAYNLSSASKNKIGFLILKIKNKAKIEIIEELDKVFSGKLKPKLKNGN